MPTSNNGKGGDAKSKTENSASTAPPTLSSGQAEAVRGLRETCKRLNEPRSGSRTMIDDYADNKMKPVAENADIGKVLLEGGTPECGGTVPSGADGKNVADLIKTAKAKLSAAKGLSGSEVGTLTQMVDLVPGSDDAKVKELAAVFYTVTTVELEKAKEIIKLALAEVEKADLASPTPADNNGANIDEVTMKMAGDIQLARGAVASEAASLAASVKSLEEIIATAKMEIADENGKGSLSDTIMLNKGLLKFEEPPARSELLAVENKSRIRAEQDAAWTALTDTDKMLPLPADESSADYKEKKDAFIAQSALAKAAVEVVRTKQTEMIKDTATLVDATKVDTLLRR